MAIDVIRCRINLYKVKCDNSTISGFEIYILRNYRLSSSQATIYTIYKLYESEIMSVPNITKQPPSGEDMTPQEKQSYGEWLKEAYNNGYERWMPWIEDQYLKWFGKGDNKASYATKGMLYSRRRTRIQR